MGMTHSTKRTVKDKINWMLEGWKPGTHKKQLETCFP